MTVRTRLAPSPTGEPHIGNMYVALFNWAFARQTGGQFLVRIEDTDRTRFVEGAEAMILDALRWLGLIMTRGRTAAGPSAPTARASGWRSTASTPTGSWPPATPTAASAPPSG